MGVKRILKKEEIRNRHQESILYYIILYYIILYYIILYYIILYYSHKRVTDTVRLHFMTIIL
jgi:hypothetical protein